MLKEFTLRKTAFAFPGPRSSLKPLIAMLGITITYAERPASISYGL